MFKLPEEFWTEPEEEFDNGKINFRPVAEECIRNIRQSVPKKRKTGRKEHNHLNKSRKLCSGEQEKNSDDNCKS